MAYIINCITSEKQPEIIIKLVYPTLLQCYYLSAYHNTSYYEWKHDEFSIV